MPRQKQQKYQRKGFNIPKEGKAEPQVDQRQTLQRPNEKGQKGKE